jgi:hypothetical protein
MAASTTMPESLDTGVVPSTIGVGAGQVTRGMPAALAAALMRWSWVAIG